MNFLAIYTKRNHFIIGKEGDRKVKRGGGYWEGREGRRNRKKEGRG